ncbi:MAG: sugar ABC transporter substrate-binding protein [Lachnospiraceae bacterium]
MEKYEHRNKGVFIALIIAVILITGIMIGFNILQHMALNENSGDAGENQQYDYHIAMIVKDSSDEFWQSVYKAARTAGMEKGIYIENFGEALNEGYTTAELMEMAILARVDGIILEADSSEQMVELINEADNLVDPIPVITISSDAKDSKRKSFVTAIDYALGEMYGSQVLEVLEEKGQEVVVLLPYDGESSQPSLVYSGIGEALQNSTLQPDLSVEFLSANDEFGAEEQIRNLLLSTTERPDVVVCLSAVDTISTYQCIVDYNLVGAVKIIGTYTSSEILTGIQKGTIYSSIAVDAKEMGIKAADGMYEYLTDEYVSDHLAVKFKVVTQENAESYIEEE